LQHLFPTVVFTKCSVQINKLQPFSILLQMFHFRKYVIFLITKGMPWQFKCCVCFWLSNYVQEYLKCAPACWIYNASIWKILSKLLKYCVCKTMVANSMLNDFLCLGWLNKLRVRNNDWLLLDSLLLWLLCFLNLIEGQLRKDKSGRHCLN